MHRSVILLMHHAPYSFILKTFGNETFRPDQQQDSADHEIIPFEI